MFRLGYNTQTLLCPLEHLPPAVRQPFAWSRAQRGVLERGKLRHRAMTAALLAGGQSHWSPGAGSNPGERQPRLSFFSVLGKCRALPVVCCLHPATALPLHPTATSLHPALHPIAPRTPSLKAPGCYQLVFAFPSCCCCWGGRGLRPASVGVTTQEDQDDAPGHVWGSPRATPRAPRREEADWRARQPIHIYA